jgi:hypothetical protein
MTDDTPDGAVDHDYDDAEQSYEERVAAELEDVQQSPMTGGIAIDLVTRQAVFVRERVADSCREYYEEEEFDLLTYKMHPWLPGAGIENAVYECAYIDSNPQNAHKGGRTYDFPEARLMHYPVELAWDAYAVGEF